MTLQRGFLITIGTGLAFAFLGAMVGLGLGVATPDYYRIVFRIPPDLPIDPAQIGLGLGLTQGLATGLIVGLVLVVTVARYKIPASSRGQPPAQA